MRFKDRLAQLGVVAVLLGLGGLALAGPYGLLEWGESQAVLDERRARIAELEERRDEYRNLNERLDPENVDPDLATELVRRNLNVAHPDEYIIELDTE
jgi:cell division protein FtsB